MNEHEITKKLRAAIEKIMPVTATVLRHVDMTQTGIPDLSYHYGGRTTWFEIKYIGPDGKLKQSALQKRNILKLSRGARVRYVVFDTVGLACWYTPEEMPDKFPARKGCANQNNYQYADIAAMMLGQHAI